MYVTSRLQNGGVTRGGGYLFKSSNFGQTWDGSGELKVQRWSTVSTSNTGNPVLACVTNGACQLSNNNGEVFNDIIDLGLDNWITSAMSGDGKRMYAAAASG